MSKSDEKIEAMMMLLLHYCAGLQHCLDAEEEVRQKGGQQGETTLQGEQGEATPAEDISGEVTSLSEDQGAGAVPTDPSTNGDVEELDDDEDEDDDDNDDEEEFRHIGTQGPAEELV